MSNNYSTNLETNKTAAHEQNSTNPEEKNRLLPMLTPGHVME